MTTVKGVLATFTGCVQKRFSRFYLESVKFRFKSVSMNWLDVCIKISRNVCAHLDSMHSPLQRNIIALLAYHSKCFHGYRKCLSIRAYLALNVIAQAKTAYIWLSNVEGIVLGIKCVARARTQSNRERTKNSLQCDSNLDLNNPNIYWLLHASNDKMEHHFMHA